VRGAAGPTTATDARGGRVGGRADASQGLLATGALGGGGHRGVRAPRVVPMVGAPGADVGANHLAGRPMMLPVLPHQGCAPPRRLCHLTRHHPSIGAMRCGSRLGHTGHHRLTGVAA
jgi:hypothetical protein